MCVCSCASVDACVSIRVCVCVFVCKGTRSNYGAKRTFVVVDVVVVVNVWLAAVIVKCRVHSSVIHTEKITDMQRIVWCYVFVRKCSAFYV